MSTWSFRRIFAWLKYVGQFLLSSVSLFSNESQVCLTPRSWEGLPYRSLRPFHSLEYFLGRNPCHTISIKVEFWPLPMLWSLCQVPTCVFLGCSRFSYYDRQVRFLDDVRFSQQSHLVSRLVFESDDGFQYDSVPLFGGNVSLVIRNPHCHYRYLFK